MLQAFTIRRALRPTPKTKRAGTSAYRALLCCVLVGVVGACAPAEPLPTAFFSAPAGMALAGRAFDQLFVANTGKDALQVVRMTDDLKGVDTVASAARFFPLNIPVGASPSEVAATSDGRYVFALDSINNQVQLIDADARVRVRDLAGHVVTLGLGGPGSEPTAMLGAQQLCTPSEAAATSDCLGRSYVVMHAVGQVAVVDVRQSHADQSIFLQLDRTLDVGGAPMRIATTPDEDALFLTDAQSAELIRMPLSGTAAQAERFALGAIGGPVTVSADGTFVLVGRPQEQDVLVLMSDAGQVGTGALQVVVAHAVWTPVPECLQRCDAPSLANCQGAHEADEGLCIADGGLAAEPNTPYAGIWLNGVPAQMAGLGPDKHGRLVAASCESLSEGRLERQYSQAVAVAQLDGTLRLIGLRDSTGAVAIELLDAGFCRAPQLARFPNQTEALSGVLAACPAFPEETRRFACAGEPDGPGVMTVLRGQAQGQAWGLTWEGVVVGGPSSFGGATVDADGNLSLPTALLNNVAIVVQAPAQPGQTALGGDIVEVLTTPAAHDVSCSQQLMQGQGTKSCQFERRIVDVTPQADATMTTLRLDRPLPRACFSSSISFRILAGDAFVVSPVDQTGMAQKSVARLALGAFFGPGLVQNLSPSFSFGVRSDLDAASYVDACSRYDRSAPGAHPSAQLVRGQLIAWSVIDPFSPQPLAERLDALSRPQGPMGRMPKGIVATRSQARQAQNPNVADFLCLSYGGSDGVLVLDPYDAPSPENRDTTSRLLQ